MASVLATVPQEVHAGDGITHCACGCGESLDGKDPRAKYVRSTHRTRHWKEQNVSPEVRKLRRDRLAKREARANGVIASDIRVSFQKALVAVTDRMWMNSGYEFRDRYDAETQAYWALVDALPERLRDAV